MAAEKQPASVKWRGLSAKKYGENEAKMARRRQWRNGRLAKCSAAKA